MNWINVADQMPPEGEYVLVADADTVGISRMLDGQWDTGKRWKRPVFSKTQLFLTRAESNWWMPLPQSPLI